MVEVGPGKASKFMALDHYSLSSLGRTNGKTLRRAMESPRHLRRHSPFIHGSYHGQGALLSSLMLLVFDYQHHGLPSRPHVRNVP
ncbi:hypothetical protein EV2_028537 [Malus domestica]